MFQHDVERITFMLKNNLEFKNLLIKNIICNFAPRTQTTHILKQKQNDRTLHNSFIGT